MTSRSLTPTRTTHLPRLTRIPQWKRLTAGLSASLTIVLHLLATPAQADPFRSVQQRNIGDRTEQAFSALFREGNYVEAERILQNPEPNEPMAFALKASLAYLAYLNSNSGQNNDPLQNQDLERMRVNADETVRVAEQLKRTDALRGNLYVATGKFLQGAYTFLSTNNRVGAVPQVLGKLQEVLAALNAAEAIAPNDPELNLLKGYMDILLAVNLPFADPNAAIERLKQHGSPRYLVDRGMAIGYRDLRRNDEALQAVDRALLATPNNPDLHYLKAQILVRFGTARDREALEYFQRALQKRSQLPRALTGQIVYEACRTEGRITRAANPNAPFNDDQNRRDCDSRRRTL